MPQQTGNKRTLLLLLMLVFWSTSIAVAGVKDQIEKPVEESLATRQKTQQAEQRWREEKQALEQELDLLQQEVTSLSQTHQDLGKQLETTATRLSAKRKQMNDIVDMQEQIDPFIAATHERLVAQQQQDLPFLVSERTQRLERLEQILDDPEIDISERYRKTMEALSVEAEYGMTIETYQQEIEVSGQDMLVNVFRLGRLALYFQTLDQQHSGFFNVADKSWQFLDDRYNEPIQTAIAIAAKQRPAQMLDLPLGRLVQQ